MADISLARSGIYEIVNTVNGKRYVGSAKHFGKRWIIHRTGLNRKLHHSRHMQAAWLKYGAEAFDFRILVICDAKDLILYEQISIDAIKPEYNVARFAGNTLGTRRTPESRAKISAKAKGRISPPRSAEYRAKISAAHKGKKKSPEHVAALQAGRMARVITDDQRAAISVALKAAYAAGTRSRARSPEYRSKISASLTGRSLTEETKAKISVASAGKKRGFYRPWSEEARQRVAEANSNRPNPMTGRKHSAETRAKISEALLGHKVMDAQKAHISARTKAIWDDPEKRAFMLKRQAESRAQRKAIKT